jgi:hypothetical protein
MMQFLVSRPYEKVGQQKGRVMRPDILAERQILKAKAEGKLDGLKGEGEPLPDRHDMNTAEAVGMRIMAESGGLPREFELKKIVDECRAKLAAAEGAADRKAAMAALAKAEMQLAIEQEARRKFFNTGPAF